MSQAFSESKFGEVDIKEDIAFITSGPGYIPSRLIIAPGLPYCFYERLVLVRLLKMRAYGSMVTIKTFRTLVIIRLRQAVTQTKSSTPKRSLLYRQYQRHHEI